MHDVDIVEGGEGIEDFFGVQLGESEQRVKELYIWDYFKTSLIFYSPHNFNCKDIFYFRMKTLLYFLNNCNYCFILVFTKSHMPTISLNYLFLDYIISITREDVFQISANFLFHHNKNNFLKYISNNFWLELLLDASFFTRDEEE